MTIFHIVTLFPEALESYINASLLRRGQEKKIIKIKFYNIRDFGEITGARVKTDARPYGGGPGMVLLVSPILRAVKKALGRKKSAKIIVFSPSGRTFTNTYGAEVAKKYRDVILICGRYEGIDARVKEILHAEEISIGSYVLTGGELPALVVMDAISRHIPGFLGKAASLEENRISSHEVYTRPEILEYGGKIYSVPNVLLAGNHKKIKDWKMTKGASI